MTCVFYFIPVQETRAFLCFYVQFTTSVQLKIANREHLAPGCAWSWAPGGMIGPMGGLHSHVVSLTRLHVLQIHRVGKVGHRRTDNREGVTQRRQTLSTAIHKRSSYHSACH